MVLTIIPLSWYNPSTIAGARAGSLEGQLMSRSGHLGVGDLIQTLSLKVSDMQHEIAGLRQDVKMLTHLVRQLQPKERDLSKSKQDTVEEHEP